MRPIVLLMAAIAAPIGPVAAQEKPTDTLLTVARYFDYETVSEPRVSPDGSQVVFTRRTANRMRDTFESSLWIMNADGSRQRFLVRGSNAVWSPDGTRIAYLAEAEPTGNQIHVRYMDAEGAVTQVTRVTEAPADLRWSPDGTMIGFSMFVPSESKWRIDMPTAPSGAQWTKAPRLVEALHYRADRRGFLEPGHTHLFMVPAIGGTPRQITRGDWNVGSRGIGLPGTVGWDWLPGAREVVVDGNDDADADRQYWTSSIYRVDVATGARRKLVAEDGYWISPTLSPDGKTIAFTGHPAVKQAYRTFDLYTMAPDGSGIRLRSAGLDRTPGDLQWASDNSGVYFTTEDKGTVNLWVAPLSGAARQLTTGIHVLGGTSVAGGKAPAAFVVRSNPQAPPDVVRIDLRRPSQMTRLTDVNGDLLTGTRLGEVEEIWYPSTGGTRIQGWIVKPPGFDPARKYPLLFEIHGGPNAMYNVGFSYPFQNFAANGFVVLYTNPRGSTGYGSTFGNAIDKDYPGPDLDDLLAGVDTVVGRGYVDTRRLYVGGCSGGGVLSSWVTSHTDRFAAAAVRCPVTNWISFTGTSDIPLFDHRWFGAPFWENPKPWLDHSPLMHVGKVKTPTLLMTGVLDLRTPIGQTEEYFSALKRRGVPTAMLRFEGEYHGTSSRPSNFMRTQLYMMSWYNRWPAEAAKVTTEAGNR
ncbi:MAG: prolyl oligopeptidase family serine peptidase [Gemmatimonadales bacterium]